MASALPLITPEFWEDCGAQAYDDGLPVTAHNMNPGAAAIKDFENGWLRREHEVVVARRAAKQLEAACPP